MLLSGEFAFFRRSLAPTAQFRCPRTSARTPPQRFPRRTRQALLQSCLHTIHIILNAFLPPCIHAFRSPPRDGANWEFGERFDDKRVFLVPPEMGHAWVAEVEAMTEARLANSAIRYTLWSEDGSRSVSLLEEDGVVSVFLRLPDGGEKSWTEPLPADSGTITALSWQEDGTLRLECETDGGASILTLNPETGEWTQLMICGLPQAQVAGWNGRGKSI